MIDISEVSMRFPIRSGLLGGIKELCGLQMRREKNVLMNINIRIENGERVAILGPNGAGKTTFLKVAGGILLPTSGAVSINGSNTESNNLRARRNVGSVFSEERGFYWQLSLKKNLEFFGTLDDIPFKDLSRRVNESLELVGLLDQSGERVAVLSSGMKQRLAIARCMLSAPRVLLLDEPTKTLDTQSADSIRRSVLNYLGQRRDGILLLATHNSGEADFLCQKRLKVNRGKVDWESSGNAPHATAPSAKSGVQTKGKPN